MIIALPVVTLLAVTPVQAPCDGWKTRGFWEAADPATVRECLSLGYSVEEPSAFREATPLHLAAGFNDDPDLIGVLVEAGANLEALSWPREGRTPLHYAARHGRNPEVVRALVEYGADPYARNPSGRTPLHLAALFNENPAIVDELARVTDIDVRAHLRGQTPLHDATRNETWAVPDPNPAVLQVLLRHGADLSAKIRSGATPAGWAEDSRVVEMLRDEEVRREAIRDRFLQYVTTRVAAGTVVLSLLAHLWTRLGRTRRARAEA